MPNLGEVRNIPGFVHDKFLDGVTFVQYVGDEVHKFIDRRRTRVAYEIAQLPQLLARERDENKEGDTTNNDR